MCTNHGPYLRPLQVWTTSRKHFRSLESAHSSRQRAKDAAAHNALNTHAHRDNRMDWGDWRSEEINATRCVMSAPFDGRPSTRRNTRPKRTLSCQAIDRLAEWEANSSVYLRSPPMVESISITSTISGAWTSSDKLHLEDLVTLCSNGSESVRTWQQG